MNLSSNYVKKYLGVEDDMGPLTEMSLFTGAGGGVLASILLKHKIICYVERDPYCIKIIKARIADGIFDDAPIWDDIKTFYGTPWCGFVDVISAGFPCQPFSIAGNQEAENDERNCWPDTIRIIREVRPRFAFLENVPGLLSCNHGYFSTILGDLAEAGFDAEWGMLSAAALGAPHKRQRLWILATNTNQPGLEGLWDKHKLCSSGKEIQSRRSGSFCPRLPISDRKFQGSNEKRWVQRKSRRNGGDIGGRK